MPKTFKEMLATDEIIRTFALARIMSPLVVEMFSLADKYQGFWIDQEHTSVSTEQIINLGLAARANDMDCFVRMPPSGYWPVTQCLEAGAGGVMAAQIHSAEQAEEFVRWAKFAPRGARGLNVGGRDGNYTHLPASEFIEKANRENFVAIQIETPGSVDDADKIAALDGVDLLFVGPADLSLSLGIVGQFHSEKLWEAIRSVAAACKKHGKAWGAVVPDPEFAAKALENGCRMPTVGNDIVALKHGVAAMQSAFDCVF